MRIMYTFIRTLQDFKEILYRILQLLYSLISIPCDLINIMCNCSHRSLALYGNILAAYESFNDIVNILYIADQGAFYNFIEILYDFVRHMCVLHDFTKSLS